VPPRGVCGSANNINLIFPLALNSQLNTSSQETRGEGSHRTANIMCL
jgi:hypothetical protein